MLSQVLIFITLFSLIYVQPASCWLLFMPVDVHTYCLFVYARAAIYIVAVHQPIGLFVIELFFFTSITLLVFRYSYAIIVLFQVCRKRSPACFVCQAPLTLYSCHAAMREYRFCRSFVWFVVCSGLSRHLVHHGCPVFVWFIVAVGAIVNAQRLKTPRAPGCSIDACFVQRPVSSRLAVPSITKRFCRYVYAIYTHNVCCLSLERFYTHNEKTKQTI